MRCNAPFSSADDAATLGGKAAPDKSESFGDMPTFLGGGTPPPLMERGTLLAAGRYEILAILGQGAMGAVYKAKDRELDRWVAIKVIQPELANSPSMLKRFKQELILARQITHRNVVRIFDIGETDGVKFITMEYIDGGDLKSIIVDQGKIPPEEAVGIVRQICQALDAAHAEGVVHRDLKPQNIMLDQSGRVVVMDFGIAHSKEMPGMTMTGALMGTPEYMSPEQARGEKTDKRADIFAVGIIFYEMLTGKMPFKAHTVVETMYKRTHERAVPPVDLDSSIPVQASQIVMKCLETDPANRYQSVTEILADLQDFDPQKKIGKLDRVRSIVSRRSKIVGAVAASALVLTLAVIGGLGLPDLFRSEPAGAQTPITLLVADFNNATGDAVFDGTLESMTITAMEEAPFVNMYNRGQAQRLLARLENGATKLDEPSARKIAIREGISVIIAGSIAREAGGYQISARAIDAVTGKVIVTKEVIAANTGLVLGSLGRVVAPIRAALGDTTPESIQIAAAETYTTGSLEAAHAYALGQESLGLGKPADAIRYYTQAVELDQNLGRAYAGLAIVHSNQKDPAQAEAFYKKALGLLDRMSDREKYRTMGGYYLGVANNFEQGVEELRKLTQSFPADAAAWTNLSTGYKRLARMTDAADASRRSVEIAPTSLRRYNYAANSLAAGDLATAAAQAEQILKQDPTFAYAYLPLALASLLRDDPAKAAEFYTQLEKVSPQGSSFSKMGQADLALYKGRYQEAVDILLPAIESDQKAGFAGERAYKLIAAAESFSALGRSKEAIAAADSAIRANPLDEGIQFLAARTFIELGQYPKAQQLAKALESKLQKPARSLALMITGEIAMKQNRMNEAIDAYGEAQKLKDSWIVHLVRGRSYVQARLYAEALSELDAAEKRRSEAADLFDSNSTSLRYLPPLYYWMGRAQEGLGAADAAKKSYARYMSYRQNAEPADPFLADAKKRMGQ
jgi:serine/threonine protein kinase/tetratricopeptide (TPR) repeat protein